MASQFLSIYQRLAFDGVEALSSFAHTVNKGQLGCSTGFAFMNKAATSGYRFLCGHKFSTPLSKFQR
jgi:hypothetical protein